ncbi:hypothetical protein BGX27_006907, partial [Mortierella sp. AM989]
VVEGPEYWRHFFAYSKFPATILTDRKNLEHFTEKKSLSERQIRCAERLSKFDPPLVYRPSVLNGAAGTLSRMHSAISSPEDGEGSLPKPLLAPSRNCDDVAFLHPHLSVPLQPVQVTVPLHTHTAKSIINRLRTAYQDDVTTKALLDNLAHDLEADTQYI